MLLHELLRHISGQSLSSQLASLCVTGVTSDSRLATPGSVFVAINGHNTNGQHFALDALANGACLIISENPIEDISAILIVDDARLTYSLLLASLHDEWRDMNLAAVTGTDGKTSVAHYYYHFLSKAGLSVGKIGTLGIEWSSGHFFETRNLDNTTPDPLVLHKNLKEMSACGVRNVCMEASSQGLVQHRLDGLSFCVAGFTNFGEDHIEYHGGKENYFLAKQYLFTNLLNGTAVINADDIYADRLDHPRVLSYGQKDGVDIRLLNLRNNNGIEFDINVGGVRRSGNAKVIGKFNIYNVMCALGMAMTALPLSGISLTDIPGPPGRMEIIGEGIVLDYAHTPDALSNALVAVREAASGRVIVVFGCGGERDRTKRSQMGAIAACLADIVILADDNPRGEDPKTIRAEILSACPNAHNIGDRKKAIELGISIMASGDMLLIAGKGVEQYQIIGKTNVPHSDKDVVLSIIKTSTNH